MDLSLIQPVINQPALFIEDKKILVVADLHIGIEKELHENGLNAPSQTKNLTDNLIMLCDEYKPREIVLLGDIKHNIPSSTYQERKDVKDFFETIKTYGLVHVLPGNHDGNIDKLVSKEVVVHPSDGFKVENVGFVHGHRWPNEEIMQCEQIIIAHTHPTVMFSDRLGHRTFEQCWIKTNFVKNRLKEKYPKSLNPKLLIVPAFNPLCGGIAINKDGVMGPLGKIIDIDRSQVYLLDGSSLGFIKDIKVI